MKLTAGLLGLLLGGALLSACHELGHIEGLGRYGGYGAPASEMSGEIRSVDSRARRIEIRADEGRTHLVRYDDRTRVVYRERDYPVSNLESGDYVTMRTIPDAQGRLYTDYISVREGVQERARPGGQLERLEGTVEYVDTRRGQFELRDRRNRAILVSLPFDASRSLVDRFDRLREGDRVRVEGTFLNARRFELEAFL